MHKIEIKWENGPAADDVSFPRAGILGLEGERHLSFIQGGLETAGYLMLALMAQRASDFMFMIDGLEFSIYPSVLTSQGM